MMQARIFCGFFLYTGQTMELAKALIPIVDKCSGVCGAGVDLACAVLRDGC